MRAGEPHTEEQPAILSAERVVLLINAIVRHQQPQFAAAREYLPNLKCMVSTEKEPQRDYRPDFSSLDVTVQKTWTLRKTWKHAAGFADDLYVHVPYDTLPQLRRNRPRAVISYELGFRTLASVLYRRGGRCRALVVVVNESEHTAGSWGLARRMLRPLLLRSADIVTYNGSSGRRYLEQQMGVPPSKLRHNPYTAHPLMLYRGGTDRPPRHRHRLLYVGQLTDRKNPVAFVTPLAHGCCSHSYRLVELSVAGRGPHADTLRAIPTPPNLRLTLLGSVDPSMLPGLLGEHGVMVFPTLADEWGLVVEESMHSGLPVLGSVFAQSTLDLIHDGRNGWHFRPDDAVSIREGLDRVFGCDAEQIDRMAAAAREDVAHRVPAWSGRLLAQAAADAIAMTTR